MNKKLIIATISILGLLSTPVFTLTAHAEEEVITGTVTLDDITDNATVTETPTSANPDNTSTETSPCVDENGDLIQDCGIIDYASNPDNEFENAIDNGLADEPEVVCADENEPDCNTNDSETEPELWPLIVSVSALGTTVILIFIINLFGRKK